MTFKRTAEQAARWAAAASAAGLSLSEWMRRALDREAGHRCDTCGGSGKCPACGGAGVKEG